jgi:hypothetical protein
MSTAPNGDQSNSERMHRDKLTVAEYVGHLAKRMALPLLPLIALVALLVVFHGRLASVTHFKTFLVLVGAAALLYLETKKILPLAGDLKLPSDVRFVIAYDLVTFIILGLAGTILACDNWELACLLAGACLLIGGFFGLLFGYPQGVAQTVKATQAGDVTKATDKNLLADSAATLGKVITGFTLAKIGPATTKFGALCAKIGPALGAPPICPGDAAAQVLAGVIIAYFLATGFFAGLLLPAYFMDRQI